jgi:hypothetical protein
MRASVTLSEESFTSNIAADAAQSHYNRTHELKLSLSHLTKWTWSSMRISPYAFIDWNSYNNIFTQLRETSTDRGK